MRADKQKRHDELCQIIQELTAKENQLFDGKKWVLKSRTEWAALLGVSPPTITELSKIPPLEKLVKLVENEHGKQVKGMALRVMQEGEKPTKEAADLARIMQYQFVNKTGKNVTRREFGLLNGLAKNWPDGYQVAIFKHVISDKGWTSFMAALDLHNVVVAGIEGKTGPNKKFYRYPSIGVIMGRIDEGHNWKVAADTYKTDMQAGMNDPDYPFYFHL